MWNTEFWRELFLEAALQDAINDKYNFQVRAQNDMKVALQGYQDLLDSFEKDVEGNSIIPDGFYDSEEYQDLIKKYSEAYDIYFDWKNEEALLDRRDMLAAGNLAGLENDTNTEAFRADIIRELRKYKFLPCIFPEHDCSEEPPTPRTGFINTDPLILDLNRNGKIDMTSVEDGTRFDFENNGYAYKSSWITDGDGFLVRDINLNGLIDNGAELFGDNTILEDGTRAKHGFEALAALDENGDGIIDSKDSAWNQLRVWIDKNKDGRVDQGELLTLDEVGIKGINVLYKDIWERDRHGNQHTQEGTFIWDDGSTGTMRDLWLNSETIDSQATDPVEVNEDIKDLPNLKGWGRMPNLHQAMMLDESGRLRWLVEEFIIEENPDVRKSLSSDIMYRWYLVSVGQDEFEPGTPALMKKYYVLNRFFGSDDPYQGNNWLVESTFDIWRDWVFSDLNNQTHYAELHYEAYMAIGVHSILGIPIDLGAFEAKLHEFVDAGKEDAISHFFENLKIGGYDDWAIAFVNAFVVSEGLDFLSPDFDFENSAFRQSILIKHLLKVYEGTELQDTIRSTNDHSLIIGGGGSDNISSGNQSDIIIGGDGDDTIYDSGGDNLIHGGDGNDSITAKGDGKNVIYGGSGDDYISGGGFLYGDEGNDRLWGGRGDDVLDGGIGDDYLRGGVGDDIYVWGIGGGNDIIDEGDIGRENKRNIIRLGEGLTPDGLEFFIRDKDLIIRIKETGETLTILYGMGGYYGRSNQENGNSIQAIEFHDGSVMEWEDICKQPFRMLEPGTVYADTVGSIIIGSDGNDIIHGLVGDDVLDGGAGDDILSGGKGNDTYIWGLGGGNDKIMEKDDGSSDKWNVVNIFGVSPGDLEFLVSGKSLIIRIKTSGETLTISDAFSQSHSNAFNPNSIQEIICGESRWVWDDILRMPMQKLDDGVVMYTDIAGLLLYGSNGNDSIRGGAGNDKIYGGAGDVNIQGGDGDDYLDGGAGNDTLNGGRGSDSYAWGPGYGNDVITDQLYNAYETNTLYLINLNLADVEFLANGLDLVITNTQTGETLTIQNCFKDGYGVQNIIFHNGSSYTREEFLNFPQTLYSSEMDEFLSIKNNTRFVWGIGCGNDSIEFVGGKGEPVNLIELKNLQLDDIEFIILKDSSDYQVAIRIKATGETLTIRNLLTSGSWEYNTCLIKGINFANGGFLSFEDLVRKTFLLHESLDTFDSKLSVNIKGNDENNTISSGGSIIGGDGDDYLSGGNAYRGGKGNDYIYGKTYGSNTYYFGRGDGQDTIDNSHPTNQSVRRGKIIFDSDISIEDLWFEVDGSHVIIGIVGTDDWMKILYGTGYRMPSRIIVGDLELNFDHKDLAAFLDAFTTLGKPGGPDGNWTEWQRQQLGSIIETYWTDPYEADKNISGPNYRSWLEGGNGNDSLNGGSAGAVFVGGDGNDRIMGYRGDNYFIGGAGDDELYGGMDSDTYFYERGDGFDTILDLEGDDRLIFGDTIEINDLYFYRDGLDLVITLVGSQEGIRIEQYFYSGFDSKIENIYAGGRVLTHTNCKLHK